MTNKLGIRLLRVDWQSAGRDRRQGDDDRRQRLLVVLEEVARRRSSGEQLSDAHVAANHPDLLPELVNCLSALPRVNGAQAAALDGSNAELSFDDDLSTRRSLPNIPGFRFLSEVHSGGQGTVYRALQQSTGREVAVKVLHRFPRLVDADLQRFKREVRILASLKHPNIVTIHDSGIHDGQCYIAMDLVHGRAIDAVAAEEDWSLRTTILAFAEVCDAVATAHRRGIMHRDIKPSNVLADSTGKPCVLDFGLAKAAPHETIDEHTWQSITHSGQFVGSLPWASPEQAGCGTGVIDLRSDVYSLGVLLYNLLTKTFPYDVRGHIRTTLSNIAETTPIRPRALRSDIDDDLELIVLTCLEKEPYRRYQNAIDLAADVRRYLNHEPLVARTPSRTYQLGKLLRRHRLAFGFSSVMFLTVVGFSIWLLLLNAQIGQSLKKSQEAEKLADQRATEARREAKTHEAVKKFLIDDLLTAATPQASLERDITVKDLIQRASDGLARQFLDEPLIRASLLTTIGQVHRSLGQSKEAVAPLREASEWRMVNLGALHDDSIDTQTHLLAAMMESGASAEAEPLAVQLYDSLLMAHGINDRRTLQSLFALAQLRVSLGRVDEACPLIEQVYERGRVTLDDDDLLLLSALSALATYGPISRESSERVEATHKEVYEKAKTRLGASHPTTLRFALNYANSPHVNRTTDDSEALFQFILDNRVAVLGPEHPETQDTRLKLANFLERRGALRAAATMCEQASRALSDQLGIENPTTLAALDRLGYLRAAQRNYMDAVRIHKQVIEARLRLWGEDHVSVAQSYDSLGGSLHRIGHFGEAGEAHQQALATYHRLGIDGLETAWTLRGLVHALGADDQSETARPFAEKLLELRLADTRREGAEAYQHNCYARELLQVFPLDLRDPAQALESAERAYETSHASYPYNRYITALALEANGRTADAVPLLREALSQTTLDESDFRLQYESALVRVLESLGDFDSAEEVYRATLALRRGRTDGRLLDVASSLDDLGEWLLRHGRLEEAEVLLRESLAIRRSEDSGEHWKLAWTLALFAELKVHENAQEAQHLLSESQAELKRDAWENRAVADRISAVLAEISRVDKLPAK